MGLACTEGGGGRGRGGDGEDEEEEEEEGEEEKEEEEEEEKLLLWKVSGLESLVVFLMVLGARRGHGVGLY